MPKVGKASATGRQAALVHQLADRQSARCASLLAGDHSRRGRRPGASSVERIGGGHGKRGCGVMSAGRVEQLDRADRIDARRRRLAIVRRRRSMRVALAQGALRGELAEIGRAPGGGLAEKGVGREPSASGAIEVRGVCDPASRRSAPRSMVGVSASFAAALEMRLAARIGSPRNRSAIQPAWNSASIVGLARAGAVWFGADLVGFGLGLAGVEQVAGEHAPARSTTRRRRRARPHRVGDRCASSAERRRRAFPRGAPSGSPAAAGPGRGGAPSGNGGDQPCRSAWSPMTAARALASASTSGPAKAAARNAGPTCSL